METGLYTKNIFVTHNAVGIVIGKGKSNLNKIQDDYPSIYIKIEKRGIGITFVISGNIYTDVNKAYNDLMEHVAYAQTKLNRKYRYKKMKKERLHKQRLQQASNLLKQNALERLNPKLRKK